MYEQSAIKYQRILSCLSILAIQRDCLNYIRVLQVVDDERLYVCGTHAFQPQCDYLVGYYSIYYLNCEQHTAQINR